ncbi:SH3 domain-binding glutamic acid-rich-like protein 2 isoform X2 [Branchiostoma floridae]|uniref:SH3 domain-binding glutamic acid-rich-like protein 2 isoform X2 n=1 Tax=Branchiostoma floridae TaxID=7739 RepID=A0A9J7N259_BRAFL|nr:SH3 domain-binding glutamic acid-rich-like protein 2 isoform X2 [Branchiostoma floridae]
MTKKMVIKVYITGVSASTQLRKHQQDVLDIIGGMKIEHEMIDVSIDDDARQFMWTNSKQPEKGKPLPPQIFNGEEYCGGWEEFEVAKENEQVYDFLKLDKPAGEKIKFRGEGEEEEEEEKKDEEEEEKAPENEAPAAEEEETKEEETKEEEEPTEEEPTEEE